MSEDQPEKASQDSPDQGVPESEPLLSQEELADALREMEALRNPPRALEETVSENTPSIPPADVTPTREEATETDRTTQDEIERLLKAVRAVEPRSSEDSTPADDLSRSPVTTDAPSAADDELRQRSVDEAADGSREELDRLLREATELVASQFPKMHPQPSETSSSAPAAEKKGLSPAISGSDKGKHPPENQDEPHSDQLLKPVAKAGAILDPKASSVDRPSEPGDTGTESGILDQGELDALISAEPSEELQTDRELDVPIVEAEEATTRDMDTPVHANTGAVKTREFDSAPVSPPPASPPPPRRGPRTPAPQPPPPEDLREPVEQAERDAFELDVGWERPADAARQAQDLRNAILSESARNESGASESGPMPEDLEIPLVDEVAAGRGARTAWNSGHTPDDMALRLTKDELDYLNDLDLDSAPQGQPTEEVRRKGLRHPRGKETPKTVEGSLSGGSRKTRTLLAVAIVCVVAAVLFLLRNSERLPDMGFPAAPAPTNLPAVIRNAQTLIDTGQYAEAEALLAPSVMNAEPGPALTEARYLYIEAQYRTLPQYLSNVETEALLNEIDVLAASAPGSPRKANLLRWKADLYERSGRTVAALSTYRSLLDTYSDADDGDLMLIHAAELAARINRSQESRDFLLRLLQRYPMSPHAAQAKLLLGDAYLAEEQTEDARRLFTQVTLSQPDSAIGVEAARRLAEMDIQLGNYTQVIRELESRQETATGTGSADTSALLLAEAYHAKGETEKAENVLREFINVSPDSEKVPDAYIALSRILESTGNRPDALKLAMQASQRFPDEPEVLINEGELLQKAGRTTEAAELFIAAVDAGNTKPSTLLSAGNAFARANELQKARNAYERLLTEFPTSPEAFEANIGLAKTLHTQGQSKAALHRLTNLVEASLGRPRQVPVLVALGELYTDLGFTGRAADAYENAAAMSSDAETLAHAATALFRTGEHGPGLAVAHRVDLTALTAESAYGFLTAYGHALLRMDSAAAMEKMEQAYRSYPDQRTEDGDRELLKAYLLTGQTARARALVMDLAVHVETHPGDAPRFQRTATQWADALFDRGDYRTAAEAYALAAKAAPDTEDASWNRLQQANALLELREFDNSLPLLNEVAASESPFAEDARLKAAYVRLEQRLRDAGDTSMSTPTGG